MAPLPLERQLEIIRSGTVEILPDGELEKKLARSISTNRPLRIKQGFDPTAPDIHLGHTVGLRKLKQFQELGHQIVLIVGDYTGMVGDPSGRSSTRPQLTEEEVRRNAETYQTQFFKVLDRAKTEVRSNGEWFSRMTFAEIMHLAGRMTLARMLERDDFEKRYRSGEPISIHEMFYPLMQAYDSVAIKADVEIGGTDQKFNLLTGRQIQADYGVEPQVALTLPILVGTDGALRMSKSTGNYIGVDDPPDEMFGKTMSIPDALIVSYYELVADAPVARVSEVKEGLLNGASNPRDLKLDLAETLVRMYHGPTAAGAARDAFTRQFSERKPPEEIEAFRLRTNAPSLRLAEILCAASAADSLSEAKRKIAQGGVRIDDAARTDPQEQVSTTQPFVLNVGKRFYKRIEFVRE
ncbi:MAG: tyrosine--tRNA ligase [candidate division Zixibacteria bacterium]|nr:tyrosine--tRNA ligase [candidate division Zixibacteria bacterium]